MMTVGKGDMIQNAYPVTDQMHKPTVWERTGLFLLNYVKVKFSKSTAAFLAEYVKQYGI